MSGMDVVLYGSNSINVDANSIHKALNVIQKGVSETTFSHDDFTMDSFERLRVSEARLAFECTFSAQTPTQASTIWEVGTVGAGTSEALTSNLFGTNLTLPVTAAVGRFIQSYNHIRYAPGISTLFRATFVCGLLGANIRHRIGMFTDQGTFPSTAGDGFYFENDASALAFVRRYMTQGSSGGEERIFQPNWNMNKMDGTGDVSDPSKNIITLDMSKTQHLVVEYQHLGVGTIRFGFETGAAGTVWAHQMVSVNQLAEPWARTGTFPVRAEAYNYGTAAVSSFTLINTCVIQEGDVADLRGWRYFGANSGSSGKTGGNASALYPVLCLRAASTNDLTKRARIIPTLITLAVLVAGNGITSLQVALLMNPTPNTGATFATAAPGSVATISTNSTENTAITGSAVWTTIIPNIVGVYTFDLSTLNDNANVIGYNAAGTVSIAGQSVLCLAVGPLTGTGSNGASVAASVNWKELV